MAYEITGLRAIVTLMEKLKKYRKVFDLHSSDNTKLVILGCFALLFLLSILVRKSLIDFQNADYNVFSSWYDFAKQHGIHSFKYDYAHGFSNYNPPYTYFLYLSTLLPVSKIVAIKGILGFFDIILAISVYYVVKVFRPQSFLPLIAAIVTMFLPTVLITGVFWGQFDQLYVAFILFSLGAGLRNKSRWAWVFFGVAIAVKLQAIFFLPILVIMVFKKIYWHDLVWAVVSFLLLTLPPVLVGRSLSSLLSIYPDQAKVFNGQLTLNAPNMYQWFPNSAFNYLNMAGICATLAAIILVLIVTLQHKKFSNKELLVATTMMLYLVPFLLPAMHERYFFPAGIASLILAFAYPTRMFIGTAILAQVVTLFSYAPFLFAMTPLSLPILALAPLFIICALAAEYFKIPRQIELPLSTQL